MLIPAHPCAPFPFTQMPRTHHSEAQFHKKYFRSPQIEETEERIIGRDCRPTAGMRVKLSAAGIEYMKLYDAEIKRKEAELKTKNPNQVSTPSYVPTPIDDVGTIVGSGRLLYLGMCDVKWDSGLKPEIDNTYYVYQVGNDGLYHLALVEDTPWAVPEVQPLGVTEEDARRLKAIRQQEEEKRRDARTAATANGASRAGTGVTLARNPS